LWCWARRGKRKAQDTKTPYPNMAPVDQYLIADRDAEIALARSAAPESISHDAEVMVLGRHGYETAVKGKNGFVCMVERSWTAGIDDPELLESQAAWSGSASTRRPHEPTFHSQSRRPSGYWRANPKLKCSTSIKAALDKKELPMQEPGAMCYMLSKQQYLGDSATHWHPHLMFFVPQTDAATWGANLARLPDSCRRRP
jgi:hypothetical protein